MCKAPKWRIFGRWDLVILTLQNLTFFHDLTATFCAAFGSRKSILDKKKTPCKSELHPESWHALSTLMIEGAFKVASGEIFRAQCFCSLPVASSCPSPRRHRVDHEGIKSIISWPMRLSSLPLINLEEQNTWLRSHWIALIRRLSVLLRDSIKVTRRQGLHPRYIPFV